MKDLREFKTKYAFFRKESELNIMVDTLSKLNQSGLDEELVYWDKLNKENSFTKYHQAALVYLILKQDYSIQAAIIEICNLNKWAARALKEFFPEGLRRGHLKKNKLNMMEEPEYNYLKETMQKKDISIAMGIEQVSKMQSVLRFGL